MKVQAFLLILLISPLSAFAHDFWIMNYYDQLKLCGGHNFPECEFAPGKIIDIRVKDLRNPEEKIQIERKGKYILIKKGFTGKSTNVLGFTLKRKNKVVYCGFLIISSERKTAEKIVINAESVKMICGENVSFSINSYPFYVKKESVIKFSNNLLPSWSLTYANGKTDYLLLDAQNLLKFTSRKKGFYLLLSEGAGKAISIVLEVKE